MALPADSRIIGKVVRHYLKYDRENPFIFISAILAFLGISAGVMVLMVAMGIMNGTQKEFRKKLFVMNYPLTVISYGRGVRKETVEKIEKEFPSLKLSPFYSTQVIAKNFNGIHGGILYGVDFASEASINPIFAKAVDGSGKTGRYDIVIGDDLAIILGTDRGNRLLLYFSKQQAAGFGTMPIQKHFTVKGTFDSGLNAYDKAIMYTTTDALRKILKKPSDRYDGVHIYAEEPRKVVSKIKAILPDDADIEGWWQQNGNFFAAMEMEKKALFLVLLMIILVASLNIISSLLMTVMSRRSEIALLRTLGASKKEIHRIFFRLGLFIGTAGIGAGTLMGLTSIWILKRFDIVSLPKDVYGTNHLPVDLTLGDFSMIIAGTIAIVFVSALYPARKASSTEPLNVLKNE
jgi:putative ABC transport system permease protein